MCDYSLAHFPNRLAVEGEELVVHRFPSGALGLASPDRSLKQLVFRCHTTAVCVPPGARLLLKDIPKQMQEQLGVGEIEEATFVEQGFEAFRFRDAVCFANGRTVLLQRLPCGLRVRILSLNAVAQARTQPELLPEESAFAEWRTLRPIL